MHTFHKLFIELKQSFLRAHVGNCCAGIAVAPAALSTGGAGQWEERAGPGAELCVLLGASSAAGRRAEVWELAW